MRFALALRRRCCSSPRPRTRRSRGRRRARSRTACSTRRPSSCSPARDAGGEGRAARPQGVRGRVRPDDRRRPTPPRTRRSRRAACRGARRAQTTTQRARRRPRHGPRRPVPRRLRRHHRGRRRAATRTPPRRWLLLREYRTATRFTRPGAEATLALDQLGTPQDSRPKAAAQAVTKDLLDAYQARLRELLADVRRGVEQNLPARRAEAAAQAAGYFAILAPRYARGPRRRGRAAGAAPRSTRCPRPRT